jgi:hypothetical protein
MKQLALALALSGALCAARAAEYAPQEFDFSELGIVESVRQVPIAAPLQDVFEHAVKPETAHELVIRIDDGRAVVLRQDETRRFSPGQRVRLVSSTGGPRVEHEQ